MQRIAQGCTGGMWGRALKARGQVAFMYQITNDKNGMMAVALSAIILM